MYSSADPRCSIIGNCNRNGITTYSSYMDQETDSNATKQVNHITQETPGSGPRSWTRSRSTFLTHQNVAFSVFTLANILAAIYAPIQDCDEVFNYWEPTHYLNHGFGLQTWEYSPEYAIRSWLYTVLHAIPGKLGALFFSQRRYVFYFIRILLAFICAGAETFLFESIAQAYNLTVAASFLISMTTAPGMFHASVAYLPSSFAMYTSMMGLATFIGSRNGSKTREGITWFGLGATIGWPFSAALILPLFTDELVYLWLT